MKRDHKHNEEAGEVMPLPKLVSKRANRRSNFYTGRTITEKRGRVEKASERMVVRKKNRRKQNWRIIGTVIIFVGFFVGLLYIGRSLLYHQDGLKEVIVIKYEPTIKIEELDGAGISKRVKEYIGQAEVDFRDLGYQPVRAVIPVGAIREVNFYLEGVSGFIKMTIDRGTAVSVEDADRMLKYLEEQGIKEFLYIDVRIERKGYFK